MKSALKKLRKFFSRKEVKVLYMCPHHNPPWDVNSLSPGKYDIECPICKTKTFLRIDQIKYGDKVYRVHDSHEVA